MTTNQVFELEAGRGGMRLLSRAADALAIEWTDLPRGGSLGLRCRAARIKRGWTQKIVSERAEVSIPAVIRLEQDRAHVATLERVLAVLAPKLRPSNARSAEVTSLRDVRFTPPSFLIQVQDVIGPVDLDPAGHPDDYVPASRRYIREDDGLSLPWDADTIFVNPPYSQGDAFLRKANRTYMAGEAKTIMLLLPARTHTRAFQEISAHANVLLLSGRIRFWSRTGPLKFAAPFPSAVVLFGANEAMIKRALVAWPAIHIMPANGG